LTNFRFDSRNRLVQAGDTVYHYNAENQRIGVNQTQYVVNSQPALSQVLVKEDNGQKTFYVYGLGLIGQESNGDYLSYHFDYRGSTVALTSDTAQVIERFQYSPYGVLLIGDASITPFLFNGMYGVMTDDNGLYYMRARFYSPEIRRFVNQDILLGDIGEGQTLNRYAYVTGQPISFVDPFGLEGVNPNNYEVLHCFGKRRDFFHEWICVDGSCAGLMPYQKLDSMIPDWLSWLFPNKQDSFCPDGGIILPEKTTENGMFEESVTCIQVKMMNNKGNCNWTTYKNCMGTFANSLGECEKYNLFTHNCHDWAAGAHDSCRTKACLSID
jgi:RHS repeat-associated protein